MIIFCSECEGQLMATLETDNNGDLCIDVDPCENCMENAKISGYQDGYDDGEEAGREAERDEIEFNREVSRE